MLLPIPHLQQQQQADCLAACAAMVLQYLHIPFQYQRLQRQLGVTEGGAAFAHLENLRQFGLTVVIGQGGEMRKLLAQLETWLPIIVAVETWALPYWQERTDIDEEEKDTSHAIVVVGIIDDQVYVNDPSFPHAPHVVPFNAFLAAWAGFAYRYAMIGLTDIEL